MSQLRFGQKACFTLIHPSVTSLPSNTISSQSHQTSYCCWQKCKLVSPSLRRSDLVNLVKLWRTHFLISHLPLHFWHKKGWHNEPACWVYMSYMPPDNWLWFTGVGGAEDGHKLFRAIISTWWVWRWQIQHHQTFVTSPNVKLYVGSSTYQPPNGWETFPHLKALKWNINLPYVFIILRAMTSFRRASTSSSCFFFCCTRYWI